MSDFYVKVYRHYENSTCSVNDGWFFSKVYSINETEMLVYDDATGTAFDDEPPCFEWVNFREFYDDHCSNTRHALVELATEEDYKRCIGE